LNCGADGPVIGTSALEGVFAFGSEAQDVKYFAGLWWRWRAAPLAGRTNGRDLDAVNGFDLTLPRFHHSTESICDLCQIIQTPIRQWMLRILV
jgi:hypothetical protein